MSRATCMWRDVETGERVCLMNHDHRPIRTGPMAVKVARRRRVQLPWRRLGEALAYVWIAAWATAGLYALLVAG